MRGIRLSTVDLNGLAWRKSSRSGGGNDTNCVEVAFAEVSWRKSSRSGGGNNDNCIEVAFAGPAVAVRDSKNTEAGGLVIPTAQWRAFLAAL